MSVVPVALLGLLEREPSHGYDLKREYDAYFGRGRPLPFGQVYATLARLARDGKVVAGSSEPGARRRAPDRGPGCRQVVRTDTGVAGRHRLDPERRDGGGDGAERIGQIDPVALPRRDPRARQR